MKPILRPVQPDDYPALARTADAAFPGVVHSAAELMEEDQPQPPARAVRWVAELEGEVVGTVSYFQVPARYHPRKFWMDAWVRPDRQGRGLGSALLEHLLAELRPHAPQVLRSFTREDLGHSLRFLERRGFVEAKRTWESWLDLTQFDPAPFAGVVEAVRAEGIAILPLSALRDRPGWTERLLDLYNTIQADVPDIDPATPISREQLEADLQSASFLPDGYFIALDGDRWVGLGSLFKESEEGLLYNGVTGVRREYRGRRIALALKLTGIAWARGQGARRMKTHNASTNRPMLAINDRLGYVRQPGWLHMIRSW
ncbi:MAG: GNAT family N-acetyltransferase [Bacillota bacterium]